MSVTALHDFFAVLAIIAIVGTVLMVLARIIPSVITVRFLAALYKVNLWLAALVATTASLGSFYMSEYGNHWTPCRFCWFQRIFMYPLAIILIIAAIRKDRGIKWYAAPLAGIGLLVSLWHNQQRSSASVRQIAQRHMQALTRRMEAMHTMQALSLIHI